MTSAHTNAKYFVTISDILKNALLLNTVRSAEFSHKKRKHYNSVCHSWKSRSNNQNALKHTGSHTVPTNSVPGSS